MEMAVGPAHRCLQDEVEPVEEDLFSDMSSRPITVGSTSSSVTLRRAIAGLERSCGKHRRSLTPPCPFPRQESGEPAGPR
jgi:hypothetical protein